LHTKHYNVFQQTVMHHNFKLESLQISECENKTKPSVHEFEGRERKKIMEEIKVWCAIIICMKFVHVFLMFGEKTKIWGIKRNR